MTDEEQIRLYQNRLRIFLIIYFFSEEINDPNNPDLVRVLKSEIKIQKIDFLLRNPDYLAFELLNKAENGLDKKEIKEIVKKIFNLKEPDLHKLEMEKFFYGAYEDIDEIIIYLKAIGFIKYTSKRNTNLNEIEKRYYITNYSDEKVSTSLKKLEFLSWYKERCILIKKYFGHYTGNQLKEMQYKITEYDNASYGQLIGDIQNKVKIKFQSIYKESL